jgi:uncharacterized protein (TIGR02466 family)
MNYQVTPLFAIPLYQTQLDQLTAQEHDFILGLDYERMPADNGDYTKDKYVLEKPELTFLKERIVKGIDHFVYEVLDCSREVKFEIQNSWINRHGRADFAGTHRHSNSLISGVYYIDVDQQSGAIVFEKDKSHYNLWPNVIDIEFNYQTHEDQSRLNIFNADGWGIYPKPNELIMFPSHLYHGVGENHSDIVRYSLAFNVFPKGNLGGKLNTLCI